MILFKGELIHKCYWNYSLSIRSSINKQNYFLFVDYRFDTFPCLFFMSFLLSSKYLFFHHKVFKLFLAYLRGVISIISNHGEKLIFRYVFKIFAVLFAFVKCLFKHLNKTFFVPYSKLLDKPTQRFYWKTNYKINIK